MNTQISHPARCWSDCHVLYARGAQYRPVLDRFLAEGG